MDSRVDSHVSVLTLPFIHREMHIYGMSQNAADSGKKVRH